jgi:hypothetical protein
LAGLDALICAFVCAFIRTLFRVLFRGRENRRTTVERRRSAVTQALRRAAHASHRTRDSR